MSRRRESKWDQYMPGYVRSACIKKPLNFPGLVYVIIKWDESNRQINKHEWYVHRFGRCLVYKIGTVAQCKEMLAKKLNNFMTNRNRFRRELLTENVDDEDVKEPASKRIKLE